MSAPTAEAAPAAGPVALTAGPGVATPGRSGPGAGPSTVERPRARQMLRLSFVGLTAPERRRVKAMYAVIAAFHIVGFGVYAVFVVPAHYKGMGIGLGLLVYTLGLRHAFDADHISAIDNTTRKAISERQGSGRPRPLAYGFFFSLGHCTVVAAMGFAMAIAERAFFGVVTNEHNSLHQIGGFVGTAVSATFLFLIGALNLVVLVGIAKVFRAMRRGRYDEAELERQLDNRGFFYRFFGRWMKAIDKEWQMYPVGFLFGLGFDTTTEVALLATTAVLATQHMPWYALACLPVIFASGMTLMDTSDGIFMNVAYGWAFFNPVRKVYYNLAITSLSVAICFLIGAVEVLSLLPQEIPGLSRTHGFWGFMYNFNLNLAGFVIVGMFIATWVVAVLVWRYGRVEERWTARLR